MSNGDARARLEACYPALRRFAGVVAPAHMEPDDLVQEAMVRALRTGLDDIDDLGPYLRRTVLNLSSNERRRWKRAAAALQRVLPRPDEAASTYVDAADLLRLSPEARAVLWLSEVEGWPYRDIADIVGCTEEAARARASRARRQLRTALVGEGL